MYNFNKNLNMKCKNKNQVITIIFFKKLKCYINIQNYIYLKLYKINIMKQGVKTPCQ